MVRARLLFAVSAISMLMMLPADAAESHTVTMSNSQFCGAPVCAPPAPEGTAYELTISAGDTVEWVFADPACFAFDAALIVAFGEEPHLCYHDVVETTGAFASPKMPIDPVTLTFNGTSYSRTFDEPGTYGFICTLHVDGTDMRGTITVTA